MSVNRTNSNLQGVDFSQLLQTSSQGNNVSGNNQVNNQVNNQANDSKIGNNDYQGNVLKSSLNRSFNIADSTVRNPRTIMLFPGGGRRIQGVTRYSPAHPNWATKDYVFTGKKNGLMAENGCTITALANALNSMNSVQITPQDVNLRNGKYDAAMKDVKLTNLMTGENTGNQIKFNKSVPLYTKASQSRNVAQENKELSSQVKAFESKIKDQIKRGNPVIIGLSGLPGSTGFSRHSVTADGINSKGEIMVVDNDQIDEKTGEAKRMTLRESIDSWQATDMDTATAVTKTN
jgi:hypothetical protein